MKFKATISLLLIALLLLKCSANEENEKVTTTNLYSDSIKPPLIIKLERGAFHYDTFTLTDSVLTYIPEDNIKPEQENIYSNPIVVIITKEQREELGNLINNENFWSYENEYKAQSSCTSSISISISLGKKNKNIVSDDYKRDCPKGLYLLEKKLIELSGKDLKRIYLPG